MNKILLIGGMAALAIGILGAVPARADDDCDRYGGRRRYDSRYDSRYPSDRYSGGNYGDRWHRDFRNPSRGAYNSGYTGDYAYYGRSDADYDRYPDRARRCGCDSRRDHRRCGHERDYFGDVRW